VTSGFAAGESAAENMAGALCFPVPPSLRQGVFRKRRRFRPALRRFPGVREKRRLIEREAWADRGAVCPKRQESRLSSERREDGWESAEPQAR
jgi:hypothetical protein